MAKKQVSYGPNAALIQGARDVAQSEVMMDSAGGAAFAQGLTQSIISSIEEQEKNNSIRDAYLNDLKSVDNIYKLDQEYNKKAVNDFVFAKKDAYAAAADCYAKTKDQGCRDQMEEIKFTFNNLNQQLDVLMNERKEYLDAYDKGQVVDLPEDSIYASAYTNKGQFQIDKDGNIGFNIDGKSTKFTDIAGKWNTKNNIAETFTLKQNLIAKKLGESGKSFYKDDIKNLYTAKFKETGPEGVMVMAKTDLTGDNEYILPNGQKASNMSFESMWSQGILADKFYEQIPKGTDTKWMYDKKNVSILNGLMSEYYTDVTESSFNQGKANYKPPVDKGRAGQEYRNYTIDGYTGIDYRTAKKQYDNMLIAGKANYDRKGAYKYVSDGRGNTDVFAQTKDGKYKKIETIPTNEALARRGLDLFGEGYVQPQGIDYDGDGIIDNAPKKPFEFKTY